MPTVLIVDDNPMDRTVAAACIESDDMDVVFAEDGRQALDLLKEKQPDVVLTDLVMPNLDGLELIQEMKHSHPAIPVIVVTGRGSEEVAVEALKVGATSYVTKRNLQSNLATAVSVALMVAASHRKRARVFAAMTETESKFELGYDREEPSAVVGYFQDALRMMNFCDETDLLRVGTALSEAITNARDHGNLELDSALKDCDDPFAYSRLAKERVEQLPFADRRVHISGRHTPEEAVYVVRDEGRGFDSTTLPDPSDPESIMRAHGRGLMLIRSFMDEVQFNNRGNEITMIKRRPEA